MIIQEITESEFIDQFNQYNRENNFSYNGRSVLYNWLMEIYTEDKPYNLDIIALCCEFVEYENITEYLNDYDSDIDPENWELTKDLKNSDPETIDQGIFKENKEEYFKEVFKELEEKTTLLKIDDEDPSTDSFIIHSY